MQDLAELDVVDRKADSVEDLDLAITANSVEVAALGAQEVGEEAHGQAMEAMVCTC